MTASLKVAAVHDFTAQMINAERAGDDDAVRASMEALAGFADAADDGRFVLLSLAILAGHIDAAGGTIDGDDPISFEAAVLLAAVHSDDAAGVMLLLQDLDGDTVYRLHRRLVATAVATVPIP